MIPDLSLKKINLFRLGIVFIFIVFLTGIILAQYISNREKTVGDNIYPNVFIDNQYVGGKSRNEVETMLKKKQKKLSDIKFTILYKEEPIATLSGQKLGVRTNLKDVVDRAYLVGRVDYLPSRTYQKVASIFGLDKFKFDTNIVYNDVIVKDFLNNAEERYNKPAKDALFKFENGRVTAFKPEEKGIKVKDQKFADDFANSVKELKKNPKNKVVTLEYEISQPEVTLGEANDFGIEELIGEGQSDYSGSHDERIHNLLLAASRVDGTLVPKGEEFSFDKTVGEISRSTGYSQAYVIKAGKTVLDDGGGVCQVSTTMFRAALNTGLPITERNAHAYRVGYYENDSKPGFDATIFEPSVDFKFKNDTDAAILIQLETEPENNIIRFKLYGKKDNRKVTISNARVWDIVPPLPDVHQDDPTLPKGTVKQVDFAAGGAKASFHYLVTKDGKTTFEQEFFSNFRPWQAVYLVGTGG